ncbi:MAG: hypothetical protein SVR08_10330 [Spirochaetota bacterium]|nr:hypothetical protein [Spirochaetota bacterium]
MKSLFIENNLYADIELIDSSYKDEFLKLISEYKILESNIIYFAAGDSKIKEIMLKLEPTYSA